MHYLKQSTAATVRIGPFLDETTGKDAEAGLTIAQADVRLSKAHGVFAQKTESTTCTHEEAGWYQCPLDTTDTATLGPLTLAVHESGALPVWHEYAVLAANIYDSLIGGGDLLEVDIQEVDGDTTAAANLNSACDNYSATRGLTGTAVPAAVADAPGGLPTTTKITDARLGALTDWIDDGRLDAILDAILADTGTDGVVVKSISAANLAKLEDILDGTGDTGLTLSAITISGSAIGISVTGTTAGVSISGGTTGIGLDINGGSSSGVAVDIDATVGEAVGITSADGAGIAIIAGGAGAGIYIESAENAGVYIDTAAAAGVYINAIGGPALYAGSADDAAVQLAGVTYGIMCVASDGPGALIQGTTYGLSAQATAGTAIFAYGQDANGHGIHAKGDPTAGGTGAGVYAEGGATGPGLEAYGGATSGDGAYFHSQTSGDGLALAGAGNGHGMDADKAGTGADISAALTWNADWDAEVQSECADALAAYGASTHDAAAVWSAGTRTITGLTAAALADFFDTDSGTDYASAVAGSVVKETADNAGGSALTEAGIADAVWDEAQSGHTDAGSFGKYLDAQISGVGGAVGSGATTYTVTVNDGDGNPLDGVEVWVTSDEAGSNVVAGVVSTNASGQSVFQLDAGTYYLWKQLAGYNFTNPETITVS